MKTIMLIALMLVAGITVQAQTAKKYAVNSKGDIVLVKADTTKTAKVADPVYKKIGDRTFYKGAKGGIYEWKVSKTGKKYKAYLPKEK